MEDPDIISIFKLAFFLILFPIDILMLFLNITFNIDFEPLIKECIRFLLRNFDFPPDARQEFINYVGNI